ncbi:MAG: LytR/AlgR family response regulator transcription factor [Candidatus Eiseniibacteriota bacterium]
MKTRVVIVEDEPLARKTLGDYVRGVDWLESVGEAADGREAVELIDALEPDLVFLDVKLPELSGLEVLQTIRHDPAVVFTTAYDRFAVAAFELEAIDYLIKPFGEERFRTTLERVRRRLTEGGRAQAAAGERARAALGSGPLKRLFARRADGIVPILLERVSHIEAADDYVTVHVGGVTHLLHVTLGELESRLDPERFLRIHRSHIVNLDEIASIRDHGDRRLAVTLRDGQRIVASRSGSRALRDMAS